MKKVGLLLTILATGFGFLTIPSAFKNQAFLHHQMDKVLKLKIRDSFSGGEKQFRFSDPMGDDNGSGELLYPRNKIYQEYGSGLLDILSFTIHKPVTNEDWSDDFIYWQFSYKFKNLVPGKSSQFIHPVITHYFGFLDQKGDSLKGSTETLNPRGELVNFNSKYPWQFVLEINGADKTAKISSYDKLYNEDITLMVDNKSNTIIIRVPLKYKPLRMVFENSGSFHYVLVGAYDELSTTGFMPIKKRAGLRNGGGAKSNLTPRVYDYLSPNSTSQKNVLASFDSDKFRYATLDPVIAIPGLVTLEEEAITPKMLKEAKVLTKIESDNNSRNAMDILNGKFDSDLDLGRAYFNAGRYSKAEELFNNVIDSNKSSSIALAYLGSITALKGGDAASPAKAMKFVYSAFDLYDLALLNVTTLEEELTVRLNRGNVALSIPESVFLKCEQGSRDFIRAAEIYKEIYPNKTKDIAHSYIMAAMCLKEIGKVEDSKVYFEAGRAISEIYSSDNLILLQNGVPQ